jgi:alkylated DNA repair dioxygenase AlkB
MFDTEVMAMLPLSLFAVGEPTLADHAPLARHQLDPACWIDYASRWLEGADALLDSLVRDLPWRQGRRLMWGSWVDEPRLTTSVRLGEATPLLRAMARALAAVYGVPFDSCWCNYYRDGHDSVAWHADQEGKLRRDPLVAIVSLGGPRRFAVRPRGGGPQRPFVMHSGDLLVMGGAMQHRWEHAVPKCATAPPRRSVTFRHG